MLGAKHHHGSSPSLAPSPIPISDYNRDSVSIYFNICILLCTANYINQIKLRRTKSAIITDLTHHITSHLIRSLLLLLLSQDVSRTTMCPFYTLDIQLTAPPISLHLVDGLNLTNVLHLQPVSTLCSISQSFRSVSRWVLLLYIQRSSLVFRSGLFSNFTKFYFIKKCGYYPGGLVIRRNAANHSADKTLEGSSGSQNCSSRFSVLHVLSTFNMLTSIPHILSVTAYSSNGAFFNHAYAL